MSGFCAIIISIFNIVTDPDAQGMNLDFAKQWIARASANRLIFLLFFFTAGFIDVAIFFLAQEDHKERVAQVESLLQRTVDSLAVEFDNELNIIERTLSGIGEVVAARGGLPPEADLALHRLTVRRHALTPMVRSILIVRPDGSQAAHSLQHPPTSTNLADRDYFWAQAETFDTGLFISPYIASRLDGSEVSAFSMRINSDGGQFLGVAVAAIVGSQLDDILALQHLPNGYRIQITLADGTGLACFPAQANCRRENWLMAPLFRDHVPSVGRALLQDAMLFDEPIGFAAYRVSGRYPLVISASAEKTAVMAVWHRNLVAYFFTALISNAALLYMSLYAARQFAARREALRALEEANESLERRVSERTAELQHYQGHLEDMVHARTLELAQARDDAEAASRAKSALLANMTHELRTPLHQISGLVLILQRRIEDEKQKSSLDKIGGAARRLQTLLENILELARVESGRVVIESKPFAPAMLLTDAVNRWQAEAARKGLHIEVATSPDLPASVCGDFVRIAEVIDCLTSNAIKFTSQGTITLRETVLEHKSRNCLMRFEVADTGIGIAAEYQQAVFGQFTQVDDSMTRKFGGAGVGLALSRRLVELMGGEIGFDSEPAMGSVFWFTLWLPMYCCSGEADDSVAG